MRGETAESTARAVLLRFASGVGGTSVQAVCAVCTPEWAGTQRVEGGASELRRRNAKNGTWSAEFISGGHRNSLEQ